MTRSGPSYRSGDGITWHLSFVDNFVANLWMAHSNVLFPSKEHMYDSKCLFNNIIENIYTEGLYFEITLHMLIEKICL